MALILCVDDEPIVLTLLRTFVESLGHTVETADSVDDALECCRDHRPDLIITDLVMPGRNGDDLLRLIKAEDPNLPIIVLTGKGSVDAAVTCLKTGAADFLPKPLNLTKLQDSIASCLRSFAERESLQETSTSENLNILPGYHIKQILGSGFSSIVYLAQQTEGDSTDRLVALKILKSMPEGDTGQEESVRRFTREARVVSQIRHPNIVKVYDYNVDPTSNLPYIAMEYVDGTTMKDKMEDLQLESIDTRLRILAELTSALMRIHAIRLYHRDIKPHNVLLTRELVVKLADFSLVRVPHSELTMPLQILGTPAYMAPEAFYSADVDGRADLFSVGTVAYELLTGSRPFEGATHKEVSDAVQFMRPIAPRSRNPDIPSSVQRILANLLRKVVDDRYQSAEELLVDLEDVRQGRVIENADMDRRDHRNLMEDWSA